MIEPGIDLIYLKFISIINTHVHVQYAVTNLLLDV